MTNEVVHKYAKLSNWVDVCLIMALVVACVWLCVMTFYDEPCAAESVWDMGLWCEPLLGMCKDCVNKCVNACAGVYLISICVRVRVCV